MLITIKAFRKSNSDPFTYISTYYPVMDKPLKEHVEDICQEQCLYDPTYSVK